MKTDRELLELAAKAADYAVIYETRCASGWDEPTEAFYWRDKPGMRATWNPLTDDGDALRLAAKLGMNLYLDRSINDEVHAEYREGIFTPWASEDAEDDVGSATRRAIVRAAATIGEALP